MLLCLAAPIAAAQPAPTGGVDVQVRLDDFVESYSAAKTSLAFLVRDISFGYEMSGTGRGVFGAKKFTEPRQDIEQSITPGKEPRGIIIQKDAQDQPVIRIRMSGAKSDIIVRAKFIRSTWSMLVEGKTVTIIAPAADLQTVPTILDQVGNGINGQVKGHLGEIPPPGLEKLQTRTNRMDGDQVIIQGNNRGFTISYPSITATYSAELKGPEPKATAQPKAASEPKVVPEAGTAPELKADP